jgi:hypothetical protein
MGTLTWGDAHYYDLDDDADESETPTDDYSDYEFAL